MDTSTIDQAYGQLQGEFQDVARSIQTLAEKLQTAAQGGDQNAREWLLDLKQIALDVKDEQVQVNALLQAIHGFVDNTHQQIQQQYQQPQYQQPQYQQAPAMGGLFGGGGGGGGMLGGFLNSGFGRAMEVGAGIGLGEDIINSIF
jgi:phosphoglycerate-specific signal transduction histidine kinase